MQELKAMAPFDKLRAERIRELREQILRKRLSAHGLIEADALQVRLDALLAEPLGDYPLNGEPRGVDSL